jgi:hypothetical protein
MTAPTTGRSLVELRPAGAELHVGMTKLHELINSGQLTRVRIGRRSFVTRESLDSFLANLPTG